MGVVGMRAKRLRISIFSRVQWEARTVCRSCRQRHRTRSHRFGAVHGRFQASNNTPHRRRRLWWRPTQRHNRSVSYLIRFPGPHFRRSHAVGARKMAKSQGGRRFASFCLNHARDVVSDLAATNSLVLVISGSRRDSRSLRAMSATASVSLSCSEIRKLTRGSNNKESTSTNMMTSRA